MRSKAFKIFLLLLLTHQLTAQFKVTGTITDGETGAALEMVQSGDFETYYGYDELIEGIRKKEVMTQFQTLPCHFNPTFKMLREPGFQYKTQRIPR